MTVITVLIVLILGATADVFCLPVPSVLSLPSLHLFFSLVVILVPPSFPIIHGFRIFIL